MRVFHQLMQYLPLLLVVIIGGVLWSGLIGPQGQPGGARIGTAVPAFARTTLGGAEVSERELPRQPYLLNIWASWCPGCLKEHKALQQIAEQGIPIIGINYRDAAGSATKWLQRHGDFYRFHIVDNDGRLALDLGATGTPETWLVDSSGIIRQHYIGPLDLDNWKTWFEPILNQHADE